MKRIRKVVFILILAITIFNITPVMASSKGVKVKVVSVKNKSKSVKVKVKIINKSKKAIEYNNYFDLYKKKSGKWNKVRWKGDRYFTDEAYVVLAGGSSVKNYVISKKDVKDSLKKGKYQIRIKISGKNKKISFKLR
jgi:hypothetical protein